MAVHPRVIRQLMDSLPVDAYLSPADVVSSSSPDQLKATVGLKRFQPYPRSFLSINTSGRPRRTMTIIRKRLPLPEVASATSLPSTLRIRIVLPMSAGHWDAWTTKINSVRSIWCESLPFYWRLHGRCSKRLRFNPFGRTHNSPTFPSSPLRMPFCISTKQTRWLGCASRLRIWSGVAQRVVEERRYICFCGQVYVN